MIGVSSSSSSWICLATALLALDVGRRVVLLDQAVVGRVLEVRRVPRAVGQQRRAQDHVGHAAVAVVGDAHRRVQPRRAAEGEVAVVLRGALLKDVDREPDRLRRVLDQHGVVRDLERLLRVHLDRRVRERDVREQLLRLVDVLRALRHGGVGGRIDARKRAVVAHLGLALEQLLDDRRPVERQRDRLANALVGEGLLVVAHVHLAVRGRRDVEDDVARVVEDRPAAGDGDLADDVDLLALEGEDLRAFVVVERELDAVRVGLGAPVVVVADERGAHLGGVLVELERAGARERLLEVLGVAARLDDDGVVVVSRDEVREVAVGRLEGELDRAVVDGRRAALVEHPAEHRQRLRRALRVGEQIHRVDDVVSHQRRAVMERDAGLQLERPFRRVRVGRPAVRQHRLQLERGRVGDAEELADLAEHAESALIAHGDRVDRSRGDDDRSAHGAAGLDGRRARAAAAGRRAAAGVVGAAARGDDRAEQRDGHAHHRAAADELATGEPSRDQLVDQMVFELSALTPDVVHRSSWFSGMR